MLQLFCYNLSVFAEYFKSIESVFVWINAGS